MHDDLIQTFMLERTGLRGRIVRLGNVLDDIMRPHAYPEPVSHLTAEAATLTTLLASMLKFEGIFTLQAQGDGPVAVAVADLTSAGGLRACATIRESRIGEIASHSGSMAVQNIVGKGYLAFTVDQGPDTDRYQGIVELKEGGLVESVHNYFRQSEQITTGLKMAVAFRNGHWRGGGILIQHMPEEGGFAAPLSSTEEDAWRHTMILLESCTDHELTDPAMAPDQLLFRLFHEEQVRLYDPQELLKDCRCTPARLSSILRSMGPDDLRDMTDDNVITMTCQFCSRDFKFDPDKINDAGYIQE